MSPQERIKEKLNETSKVIEDVKIVMDDLFLPDYLQDLQLSSLQQRIEDLEKEEEEINRNIKKEEIILTMHPNGLPSGEVSVRELTLVLGGFQNLADSIANTLYNQPSVKGKIPQEILENNTFILKATRAGSFKAVLELKHSNQETFDEPVQTQTIEEVFSLLDSSNSLEKLIENISFLGPRTLKNYSEWTKSLKELNTSIDLDWHSSHKSYSKTSISVEKAERIYNFLSAFSETIEEELTLRGVLTGANVRTKTFELFNEDGEKVTGRIVKDAIGSVACFDLDRKCEIDVLKVTTINSSTNKAKVSWTLKDIREMNE
ncbi:hypothetical protein AB1L07_26515 [Niallia alba]|uniref:hypothetical protein n=1 Tax=Niallia alba TaxID=2729105 RepID=UPI0039A14A5C